MTLNHSMHVSNTTSDDVIRSIIVHIRVPTTAPFSRSHDDKFRGLFARQHTQAVGDLSKSFWTEKRRLGLIGKSKVVGAQDAGFVEFLCVLCEGVLRGEVPGT